MDEIRNKIHQELTNLSLAVSALSASVNSLFEQVEAKQGGLDYGRLAATITTAISQGLQHIGSTAAMPVANFEIKEAYEAPVQKPTRKGRGKANKVETVTIDEAIAEVKQNVEAKAETKPKVIAEDIDVDFDVDFDSESEDKPTAEIDLAEVIESANSEDDDVPFFNLTANQVQAALKDAVVKYGQDVVKKLFADPAIAELQSVAKAKGKGGLDVLLEPSNLENTHRVLTSVINTIEKANGKKA